MLWRRLSILHLWIKTNMVLGGKYMNNNFMKIEIPSVNDNVALVRKLVSCFAEQIHPSIEELEEIRSSVGEAVANAVVHAYPNSVGNITICCRVIDGDVLDIVVKDKGVGIEDVDLAMRPMFSTIPECSGMGFALLQTFMTSCEVKSKIGKGTIVHIKKHIIRN